MELAAKMMTGLTAHPDYFPDPPQPAGSLSARLNTLMSLVTAAQEAHAAAEMATKQKEQAMADLEQAMKDDLRYAEVTTHMDDEKLKTIGWSAHKEKSGLEPPGQVLDLTAVEQGAGWIHLEWKKPATGGTVAIYFVERLTPGASDWPHVAEVYAPKVILEKQERGIEFQYRIVASNKAGNGKPSNSVTAVL